MTRRLWLEEPSYFGSVGVCEWCGGQWGPFANLDQGEAWLADHWRAAHGQASGAGWVPLVLREGPDSCVNGCGRWRQYASGECRSCYDRRRYREAAA